MFKTDLWFCEERIIHRDIKPDKFLIGGTNSTKITIFIIDFGLAKCYKNSEGEKSHSVRTKI